MAATRRRAELGLTLLALALYAGIGAQWAVAQRPWGSYTWARALPIWVAGILPWLILGWLALRRHRHAPWLALGACAASLPFGVSRCPTFFWVPLYGGPALHRLALFAPVLAALSLVAAQQLRRERVHWRGRVSRVACGALLVWTPLYLYLAVHGFFWGESWWHAPGVLPALLPVVVGLTGMLRDRTWSLAVMAAAVPLALLVVAPEARPSCGGPLGHPFACGWGRELVAGGAALAVAPWLRPAWRAWRRPLNRRA